VTKTRTIEIVRVLKAFQTQSIATRAAIDSITQELTEGGSPEDCHLVADFISEQLADVDENLGTVIGALLDSTKPTHDL
jgi:hypothetical protein